MADGDTIVTGRQRQLKTFYGQEMATRLACLVVAFLFLGALNSSDAGK